MPETALIIKVISVVLQYGMLLILLYFVSRLIRYIYKDMSQQKQLLVKQQAAGNHKASVVVLESNDPAMAGKRYSFSSQLAIGRSGDNDIVINDAYVSHHHAVIRLDKNLWVLEDLGSSNKTYLNGVPVTGATVLHSGDELSVGMVSMQFER